MTSISAKTSGTFESVLKLRNRHQADLTMTYCVEGGCKYRLYITIYALICNLLRFVLRSFSYALAFHDSPFPGTAAVGPGHYKPCDEISQQAYAVEENG